MRQLRKLKIYAKPHNTEDWVDVTSGMAVVYRQCPDDKVINLKTIEEVEQTHYDGVYTEYKFFSKKKKAIIFDGIKKTFVADEKKLQECGGIDILVTYRNASCLTIGDLAELLSAYEFFEFIKENGLTKDMKSFIM